VNDTMTVNPGADDAFSLLNRERGLLIDKKISGVLTAEEQARLDELTVYVDKHLEPFDLDRQRALKVLEDRASEAKKVNG
jgi:hypothetical protein